MKESVNIHLNVKCHIISLPPKKKEKKKKVVRSNRGHFVHGFDLWGHIQRSRFFFTKKIKFFFGFYDFYLYGKCNQIQKEKEVKD